MAALYYDKLSPGGTLYQPYKNGQNASPGWADDVLVTFQTTSNDNGPGAATSTSTVSGFGASILSSVGLVTSSSSVDAPTGNYGVVTSVTTVVGVSAVLKSSVGIVSSRSKARSTPNATLPSLQTGGGFMVNLGTFQS